MSPSAQDEYIWEVRRVEIPPNRCKFSEILETWAAQECEAVLSSPAPSPLKVIEKMYQLQKKYFEIRAYATLPHRYLMRPEANHTCLFHTYEAYFERLLRKELALTPPLYQEPPPPPPLPPPPPPEPPQYDGLILGEIVGAGE